MRVENVSWDLIVVGGGTAGIVAARTAASTGARVAPDRASTGARRGLFVDGLRAVQGAPRGCRHGYRRPGGRRVRPGADRHRGVSERARDRRAAAAAVSHQRHDPGPVAAADRLVVLGRWTGRLRAGTDLCPVGLAGGVHRPAGRAGPEGAHRWAGTGRGGCQPVGGRAHCGRPAPADDQPADLVGRRPHRCSIAGCQQLLVEPDDRRH